MSPAVTGALLRMLLSMKKNIVASSARSFRCYYWPSRVSVMEICSMEIPCLVAKFANNKNTQDLRTRIGYILIQLTQTWTSSIFVPSISPPPSISTCSCSQLGNFSTRTEMSVHNPTATNSAFAIDSSNGKRK